MAPQRKSGTLLVPLTREGCLTRDLSVGIQKGGTLAIRTFEALQGFPDANAYIIISGLKFGLLTTYNDMFTHYLIGT